MRSFALLAVLLTTALATGGCLHGRHGWRPERSMSTSFEGAEMKIVHGHGHARSCEPSDGAFVGLGFRRCRWDRFYFDRITWNDKRFVGPNVLGESATEIRVQRFAPDIVGIQIAFADGRSSPWHLFARDPEGDYRFLLDRESAAPYSGADALCEAWRTDDMALQDLEDELAHLLPTWPPHQRERAFTCALAHRVYRFVRVHWELASSSIRTRLLEKAVQPDPRLDNRVLRTHWQELSGALLLRAVERLLDDPDEEEDWQFLAEHLSPALSAHAIDYALSENHTRFLARIKSQLSAEQVAQIIARAESEWRSQRERHPDASFRRWCELARDFGASKLLAEIDAWLLGDWPGTSRDALIRLEVLPDEMLADKLRVRLSEICAADEGGCEPEHPVSQTRQQLEAWSAKAQPR